MTLFYAFNGDADGICALQQLQLVRPASAEDIQLITGVKRDISLLKRINAAATDRITVLDISLDKNKSELVRLLDLGVQVDYFDHHFAGEIPHHTNLNAHIDTQSETCTSLIVNRHLNCKHWLWAATGAFGDNFDQSALSLIDEQDHALTQDDITRLKNLGIYMNYNAYGATIRDLHIPPETLYQQLHPYDNPLEFVSQSSTYQTLADGYNEDIQKAASLTPEIASDHHALYLLPAAAWARRVCGVFANQLAQSHPTRAHALLTELDDGGYLVSVRAPLSSREGADALCRQFETGGGRKAAAGINKLPKTSLDAFIAAFKLAYP